MLHVFSLKFHDRTAEVPRRLPNCLRTSITTGAPDLYADNPCVFTLIAVVTPFTKTADVFFVVPRGDGSRRIFLKSDRVHCAAEECGKTGRLRLSARRTRMRPPAVSVADPFCLRLPPITHLLLVQRAESTAALGAGKSIPASHSR